MALARMWQGTVLYAALLDEVLGSDTLLALWQGSHGSCATEGRPLLFPVCHKPSMRSENPSLAS